MWKKLGLGRKTHLEEVKLEEGSGILGSGRMRWGRGRYQGGSFNLVPKAGRTSFPCDKGSLMENIRGQWNHIQPQRGLQAFQGPVAEPGRGPAPMVERVGAPS